MNTMDNTKKVKNFDYIVVGAGIEGSATAYTLAKMGYKTLLLEQHLLPHGMGSSHGGSRITRKSYDKKLYTEMMLEGDNLWKSLEKECGQELMKKVGLLLMAPKEKSIIPAYKSVTDSYGLASRIYDGSQLKTDFPPLRNIPDHWEALFEPDAGVLLADKCLSAYQTLFKKHGGTIGDRESAQKILPKADSVDVCTDASVKYTCRSVVLCLGAWTGKFLKSHLNLTLPLQPVAITVCYWREKVPGVYSADNGFPPVWLLADDEREYFLLPSAEQPGQVKISYNHGPTVDPDQRGLWDMEESVAMVAKFVAKYFPDADSTKPVSVENCLYTFTPDNHVILDHHPAYKNVVIGAGFSGHGFKLAPVVGQILAAMATGDKKLSQDISRYDLAPVRINRFFNKAVNRSELRHMM